MSQRHKTSMREDDPGDPGRDRYVGECSCGWTTQVPGTARQVDEALRAHKTAAEHIEGGK